MGKETTISIVLLLGVVAVQGILKDGDGIDVIPALDEKVFSVLDFDAVADGETDNQEAFMNAFRAACDHPGKARFVVPLGIFTVSQVPFVGPCKGPGPMVIQITGTVKAVPDLSLYEEPEWLIFEKLDGLVIFGGGVVDGNGPQVWKYSNCDGDSASSCARLSSSIVLKGVSNASIRRFTSLNPMGFHFFITNSRNIRLQRLNIKAPGDSPNTDGVHISTSTNVKLSQLRIETGDDCVGILQGSSQIFINKVFCGPGHGISIGSLGKYQDEQDIKGIQVKNCTFSDTTNGLRIKTFPFKPNVKPIQASSIYFQDIIMNNVKRPIIIDQGYCGNARSCGEQPSRIKLRDIYFQDVRGTTISPQAIDIKCSSAVPCENINIRNVNLVGAGNPTGSICANAMLNVLGLNNPPVKC